MKVVSQNKEPSTEASLAKSPLYEEGNVSFRVAGFRYCVQEWLGGFSPQDRHSPGIHKASFLQHN